MRSEAPACDAASSCVSRDPRTAAQHDRSNRGASMERRVESGRATGDDLQSSASSSAAGFTQNCEPRNHGAGSLRNRDPVTLTTLLAVLRSTSFRYGSMPAQAGSCGTVMRRVCAPVRMR